MIAKFVKRCVILSSLPLLSSVAYASSEAPLLKGHINASESKEIAIAYDWQGDVCMTVQSQLMPRAILCMMHSSPLRKQML